MENKHLDIEYKILQTSELSEEDAELMQKALEVLNNSYSPYSHFKVGCAVRCKSNKIYTSCNQENIAYPSGLCAERSALFSLGGKKEEPTALFIAAKDGNNEISTAYPCGACRQVMAEFEKNISHQNLRVMILRKDLSVISFDKTEDLLPFGFDF
ncbi:MAG: cytidine deaminase [Bacteroidales bacterium]|nr:cytidine deaminase [Bacteroidales bacterium]